MTAGQCMVLVCLALHAIANNRGGKHATIEPGDDLRGRRVSDRALFVVSEYGSGLSRLFGGRSSLALVRQADRVEVTRLDAPYEQSFGLIETLPAYPVLAGPVMPSAGDARQLTTLLTSVESYVWDPEAVKACIPSFGVQVTFHRGGKRIDVMLCLDCAILMVFEDRQIVGAANFDPSRDKITAIVQKLFPQDEELSQL